MRKPDRETLILRLCVSAVSAALRFCVFAFLRFGVSAFFAFPRSRVPAALSPPAAPAVRARGGSETAA
jgi:hypothetical protein